MSDALGALVGGLFGLGQSGLQYAMQRDLMKYQANLNYKYGKKSTLNQYSWQRQGLEKAGYNPLLALGGAEGVANTGWTSAQSAPEVNALNSAFAWQENKRNNALNKSNIALNDATIDKTESEIMKNVYDANLTEQSIVGQSIANDFAIRKAINDLNIQEAQTGFQYAQMNKVLEETKWIPQHMKAQIQYLIDTGQSALMQGQASLQNASTSALDSYRRYEVGTKANEIAEKNLPPKWASVVGGILGTSVGAGLGVYGAIKGGSKGPNFKTSVPYK